VLIAAVKDIDKAKVRRACGYLGNHYVFGSDKMSAATHVNCERCFFELAEMLPLGPDDPAIELATIPLRLIGCAEERTCSNPALVTGLGGAYDLYADLWAVIRGGGRRVAFSSNPSAGCIHDTSRDLWNIKVIDATDYHHVIRPMISHTLCATGVLICSNYEKVQYDRMDVLPAFVYTRSGSQEEGGPQVAVWFAAPPERY